MFSKLFAESGLSLDRLRAMLEVGASGSIAKAADGDPVRQSQYSRQIKELEDFFRVKLMERDGKGMRLTTNGRELARISRFFSPRPFEFPTRLPRRRSNIPNRRECHVHSAVPGSRNYELAGSNR